MAARCDVCHRGSQHGNRVSHSNRKTKHTFRVNLQTRRLLIHGAMQNVKICTRCLRTMMKVDKPKAQAVAR
jgi:large subunit ribosomal protein L28